MQPGIRPPSTRVLTWEGLPSALVALVLDGSKQLEQSTGGHVEKLTKRRRRTRGNGEGSVYKRSSDGIWVAALTLPSGRRKVVYGQTKAIAVTKLNELKVQVAN